MTTVAYCAISDEGRTFADQMVLSEETARALRSLTDAVHREGAAASLQLGHAGFFTKYRAAGRSRPLSPSRSFNAYGLMSGQPWSAPMTIRDIERVVDDFVRAARRAREAGFDAVELHLGHGYLLSQFLSPATNRRRDDYGGDIQGRMRAPLQVVAAVRRALGAGFPVLGKVNLRDGFRGGLELDEATTVARALEQEGISALVLSGGFTSKTPLFLLRGGRPLSRMVEAEPSGLQRLAMQAFGPFVVRKYPFQEMFFLPEARVIRQSVDVPLVLLGGLLSLENLETAMAEGFDFVALGRALIADPELVNELQAEKKTRSRCTSCNECIAEMDLGGIRCILDDHPAGSSSGKAPA